jgi:hypothetical protein
MEIGLRGVEIGLDKGFIGFGVEFIIWILEQIRRKLLI